MSLIENEGCIIHIQGMPLVMAFFIGTNTIVALDYFIDQNYYGMVLPVTCGLLLILMIWIIYSEDL